MTQYTIEISLVSRGTPEGPDSPVMTEPNLLRDQLDSVMELLLTFPELIDPDIDAAIASGRVTISADVAAYSPQEAVTTFGKLIYEAIMKAGGTVMNEPPEMVTPDMSAPHGADFVFSSMSARRELEPA